MATAAAGAGPCPVAIVDDQPVSRAGMEQIVGADPRLSVVASVGSVEELDGRPGFEVVVLVLPLRTQEPTLAVIARLAAVSDRQSVTTAVRVVAEGGFYLCRLLVDDFHAEVAKPQATGNGLTPREVETLRWIAMGFTHAQIATEMGLSRATVHTYAKRIRTKLKVNNKAQLTRMAIQLGHLTDGHCDPRAA